MDEAIIHLRVPAAIKARWVRDSRAAGMRLTDWITDKVEGSMAIDLTNGADETAIWYAVVYQDHIGKTKVDVQCRRPTWTDDYHMVKTPAWYAGTEDEWCRHIGGQVIAVLANQAK